MEKSLRKAFNDAFTQEAYEKFKNFVGNAHHHTPVFRLCETPVFIGDELKRQLLEACEQIGKTVLRPDLKAITEGSLLSADVVPNEDDHTVFLQMDFGICQDDEGNIFPRLIEMQGFPSLYFFQEILARAYRHAYDIPAHLTPFFGGLDAERYRSKLRQILVADEDPKHVVLLEIEPEKQATQIDFWATAHHTGMKVLCLTKVIKKGKQLFYLDDSGQEVRIKRIYNRVIFDELQQRPDLKFSFSFTEELDVEWVGHPNWYYRISKYIMPLLESQYVPDCHYLKDLLQWPDDIENWVLKPLYSFAGSGVRLHISHSDLDAISDRENFILQRKVNYAPVIDTPSGGAKFEIRMLTVWEKNSSRFEIINNLVRVSKGEMVGVRYNKDKDWVGSSVAFFNS
jgi:hypothetical protein